MAKNLIKPVLFSKHARVPKSQLDAAGLFDPILNSDSKLFIDPLLLSSSDNAFMKDAYRELKVHLAKVISLISASKQIDDPAWKSARKFLSLKERSETCLGYGGTSTSGSSRSKELADRILETAKQIIDLGDSNPEIISLMGMFEEGVGPDTISDLATNAIMPVLCELTEDFCNGKKIPNLRAFADYGGRVLPENPFQPTLPVVLVPRDILRDLPLAADWSDVSRVTFENERIRDQFNKFVGNVTQATVTEKKEALKRTALASLQNFKAIFSAVIDASDAYDPNADPLNLYRFRDILAADIRAFKDVHYQKGPPTRAELMRTVMLIVQHFQQMVENNNLWELLWIGNKPKRERASQLLFFAVADAFCRANDVDIAPETNAGGGPVDFRFSAGYTNRVVVEVKLSKGQVEHGFKTQIGIYQNASVTDAAVFLIINVGGLQGKLRKITAMKEVEEAKGRAVPEIVIVDARRRQSASVRPSLFSVLDEQDGGDDNDS